jgi:divalent metal cation (Fe/Co/Zn/Cd) transporter
MSVFVLLGITAVFAGIYLSVKLMQVRILWEDHRNDLFINGFGIMTSVLGSKIAWWLDPMGATILAFLIIGLWGHTAYRTLPLSPCSDMYRRTTIINRDFSRAAISATSNLHRVNPR